MYRVTGKELVTQKRVLELAFGYYAWAEETTKVEEAGSGILVAPRLALTAKHVTRSFARLDTQVDGQFKRQSPLDSQYRRIKIKTDYGVLLYQYSENGLTDPIQWGLKTEWASYDTDISMLFVEPRSPAAVRLEAVLRYLEWQLLPPKVGEVVWVYGWPDQNHTIEDGFMHETVSELHVQPARIVEHVYPMFRHRYVDYPAFKLDREFGHGTSGGAVVHNGRLAGIFTGPEYVACLWPLAVQTYLDLDEIERPIAELLDDGTIGAADWDEVKGRVERVPCEEALAGTSVETRCDKQHVMLRSS